MKKYITISGKKYPVEIKNGQPLVNGMTVSDFSKTLTKSQLEEMAMIGAQHVDNLISGKKPFKLQDMANDIHSAKNN